MGAEIVILADLPQVSILPQGTSLAEFIAHCQAQPLIKTIEIIVQSSLTWKDEENTGITNLPFYRICRGKTQSGYNLLEHLPSSLGEVAYPLESKFSRPCRIRTIQPKDDITEYALECAVYTAQHGLNVRSQINVPEWDLELNFSLSPQEAQRMLEQKTEPLILYMS